MNRHVCGIIIFALLSLMSCDNKALVFERGGSTNPADTVRLGVASSKTYSVSELVNLASGSLFDYVDDYLTPAFGLVVKTTVKDAVNDAVKANRKCVDNVVAMELNTSVSQAKNKWSVRIYNFNYLSTSYAGEPIILSAALCVPSVNGDIAHSLDAMSLCPPHMSLSKDYCPTRKGTILMARVAFNHAVVVPDYQGRGVTSQFPFSDLHTMDHAKQSIDAALAALDILKQEGYVFGPDFGLYNVGVSAGGEVAYTAHKLIENDVVPDKRNLLNLKMTYAANGIVQHCKYVDVQMHIYKYKNEADHKTEMDFYKGAFDCFTEYEKGGWTGEDLYSHDIMNEDMTINTGHPLINTLKRGLARNDMLYNWNPQQKLEMDGSPDDNDVIFSDHFQYAYNELLKNRPDGTPNANVILNSFDAPALFTKVSDFVGPNYMLAHIAADWECFKKAIQKPDPLN